ncbi:MAG TPA: hypothetical protein VMA72_30310 [Streptosporangiaceae bacterium]|nr:hypothetical protein [Streptosporangiaceae bacterium]
MAESVRDLYARRAGGARAAVGPAAPNLVPVSGFGDVTRDVDADLFLTITQSRICHILGPWLAMNAAGSPARSGGWAALPSRISGPG